MECVDCSSVAVLERRDRTAQGYRRFRCRDCGRQFNECSAGVLNRTQYPSDVIALVVLWRVRCRLTLQDLSEMFLERGIIFSHETVRESEEKLVPILTAELPQRRRIRACGRLPASTSWLRAGSLANALAALGTVPEELQGAQKDLQRATEDVHDAQQKIGRVVERRREGH